MTKIALPSIVEAFRRRQIQPDQIQQVNQGTLNIWYFANTLIGELVVNGIRMTSNDAYINTTPPQEIADDIFAIRQGDDPLLQQWSQADVSTYMSQLGKSTSDAKVTAARENGKRGGRPRKKTE